MLRQLALAAGLGVVLVASGSALAASKCDSGVTKAAGKKEGCLCGVYAKAQAKGLTPDPTKIQKCKDKFSASCTKAQSAADCGFQTESCTNKETDVENEVAGTCNPSPPAAAGSKCDAGKTKAAGKKVSCKCGVYAKTYANDLPPDPIKLQKCIDKFTAACTRAASAGDCFVQTRTCAQLETDADQDVTALCTPVPTITTSSTTTSTTTSTATTTTTTTTTTSSMTVTTTTSTTSMTTTTIGAPTCANGGIPCGSPCGGACGGTCAGPSTSTCTFIHCGPAPLCVVPMSPSSAGDCLTDGPCPAGQACVGPNPPGCQLGSNPSLCEPTCPE